MSAHRLILINGCLITLLMIAGCATDRPGRVVSGDRGTADYWVALAKQNEQAGDLQQARYRYRVAQTLSHNDREITRHIKGLDQAIRKKTHRLAASAQQAMQKGQLRQAQNLYLDLLGLNPANHQALEALRSMDERQARQRLQAKYPDRPRKSRKAQDEQELRDEGYAYSRQSILQADDRARNDSDFIKELETHVLKYPQDDELRTMLLNLRLSKAQQAFDRQDYAQTLNEIQQAENSVKEDKKALSKLSKQRKTYAKTLYLEGVQRVRENRDDAVALWQAALKFNPQDKKIQLRIQNSVDP
jgi:tetratricopeptide (TPR) repeat protein